MDQLPLRGRFKVARVNDPEYVRQLVEAGFDISAAKGKQKPSLSDYGPVEARLDSVVESVDALRATVIKALGGKPGAPLRMPRPETAFDNYREQLRVQRDAALQDEVAAAQERRRRRREAAQAA